MKILTDLKLLCRSAALPLSAGILTLALFTPSASPAKLKIKTGRGIVRTTDNSGPRSLTTAHLNYYGGPVLSNVRIVMVRYGAGTYLGNIAGTTAPTMASFYQQVTNSSYMDWLREYNTTIKSVYNTNGTNQYIGRGSLAGVYQITPAVANNGSTIGDNNVQAELSAQIDAGSLPAPDANTLYMIHFPQGKTLNADGDVACVNFCAYHFNYVHNGMQIYYGVHPDFTTGRCASVCGSGTAFQNQTAAASHEMTETITDPEPRSGWDDPNPGKDEIGDICAYQDGALTGSDGQAYNVQKEWSNLNNACIAAAPTVDYYVDVAAGSDSNPGTAALPFQTVTKALAVAPNNGGVIHVKAGNYGGDKPRVTKNVRFINWNNAGQSSIGKP